MCYRNREPTEGVGKSWSSFHGINILRKEVSRSIEGNKRLQTVTNGGYRM